MKNSDVPMMTLRRAVQICNGVDALGDALNVSGDALERMLVGAEEIPLPVFTWAAIPVIALVSARAKKLLH